MKRDPKKNQRSARLEISLPAATPEGIAAAQKLLSIDLPPDGHDQSESARIANLETVDERQREILVDYAGTRKLLLDGQAIARAYLSIADGLAQTEKQMQLMKHILAQRAERGPDKTL